MQRKGGKKFALFNGGTGKKIIKKYGESKTAKDQVSFEQQEISILRQWEYLHFYKNNLFFFPRLAAYLNGNVLAKLCDGEAEQMERKKSPHKKTFIDLL